MKYLNYWILTFIFYSFIGTSYAAESDPPILNSISVDQSVVDVSNGPQTVTFTVDVSDDSGINWSAGPNNTNIVLDNPNSSGYKYAVGSNDDPGKLTFNVDSLDEGAWAILWLEINDIFANELTVRVSELANYGIPSVIIVDNGLYSETTPDFDFDKDGTLDALTDGLLLLRYAFGLLGDSLTNEAISSESTLTPQEVEANIEQAASIADIDNNGSIDALTDGLLLLRYAFGLRGDNLVDGAIASNSTRTSAEDIRAYIESYMP